MADCDDEHVDRISDLPMDVIDTIIQRLPIQDLVKTSVLSREWGFTWTSVSRLDFDDDKFFDNCKFLNTCRVITQVLLLNVGPLQKFILFLPDSPIKMECLSNWILILSKKGVKCLALSNGQLEPYQAPPHVFSCWALTCLFLQNFKLSIAPNDFRGFKRLFDLYLCDMVFESGALECLLSGCPLLVRLTISYCSGFEHVNVSSPFLKHLDIEGDEVIKSICLKQPQKLTFIRLFADEPGDNIERAWVSDLLKHSPEIERLSLGTGYVKILSAGINPQVQLKAIKYLKLDGVNVNEARELLFIISLLESSYNQEKLVIKVTKKTYASN